MKKKLYVGNLSFQTTEAELNDLFAQTGAVETVRIITDPFPEFAENAPLWYYVLREAELEHEGTQLGAVGGRLVAETFVGLLEADPTSYLGADPAWRPDPALSDGGRFGMPELIRATVKYL